ncbi:MAG TPA: formate dehydrogenase accessory sulfurtransferase FdhD [Sphingopyxis sp.]|nr:formate dehydrogenase accessory sulfurtransferase FdhD [Sphingopyxis sp.]HMP45016.1 formate dehydrogenase accessory sulfurtransferase FdhD [Sphingopyxis sp.]HMQ19400.1 formate dehydrogenase accessory sulfurtransferase FdhD [Sphingopyxis sp.]
MLPGGASEPSERDLAEEVPIALEFNGIGYAVLMATPADLEDLVAGFLLSERLQHPSDTVVGVSTHSVEGGIVARATLPADRAPALLDRVRHRASDSSCGLCGVENIEQAMRPLPRVTTRSDADDGAVFRALSVVGAHQHLNTRTGAAHAAALVAADGAIRLVREDVGRHNAFDKLIGAMRREALDWDGGFALLSSRCSYELVEKAAIADCPMLVTISAPTRLAVDAAAQAGLALRVLARGDSLLASG